MSNFTVNDFNSKFYLTNEDISKLGVSPNHLELYRRKFYQESFGVESWMENDTLSKHTFPTRILPLTYEEAKEIIKMHNFIISQRNKNVVFEDDEDDGKPNEEILKVLEEKISMHMKESGFDSFFVKLDTRSPKSVGYKLLDQPEVMKCLDDEFSNYHNNNNEKDNIEENYNNLLRSLIRAMNSAMKIKEAKEVLLRLYHSQRVFDDLVKLTGFGSKLFKSRIILRKWDEEVVKYPEFEFRCFVKNGELNCITQYFSYYYCETLIKEKKKFEERMVEFFEKNVKKQLEETHGGTYVVDFFVSNETDRILIIELNPYHQDCSGCLFSWQKKEDYEVLLRGPFEFRIVESLPEKNILNIFDKKLKLYLFEKHGIEVFKEFVKKKEEQKKGKCIVC